MPAEQNDASAQNNLGICLENGPGVAKDPVEAVNWYRKAAEQKDAQAEFNLGTCYANGDGVASSYVEAVKWFRKSADQGLAEARVQPWGLLREWRRGDRQPDRSLQMGPPRFSPRRHRRKKHPPGTRQSFDSGSGRRSTGVGSRFQNAQCYTAQRVRTGTRGRYDTGKMMGRPLQPHNTRPKFGHSLTGAVSTAT